MTETPRILYCHCAYAQVVPAEVKAAVLRALSDSAVSFDAVADLCEMSARQDPALSRLASGAPLKIAACYPRAVRWLFAAAKAPLAPDQTEVLNMRVLGAQEVAEALLDAPLKPNLPKTAAASSAAETASAPLPAPATALDVP